MYKVGFFGGTGFLGKAVKRFLHFNNNKEFDFFYLSRKNNLNFDKNFIFCDALRKETFPNDIDFDIVIHGISDSTISSNVTNYQKLHKAVLSTINIANFSKETSVKKIIYISSGAVYGDYSYPVKEDLPCRLKLGDYTNHYGLGKITSETLLKSFCKENSVKLNILRPFAFGGKDLPRNVHYALGNFIEDVKSGRDIIINGNGKDVRSYMHQNDFVRVVLEIAKDSRYFTIHNVGSEEKITLKGLANKIIEIDGLKRNILIKNLKSEKHNFYVPSFKKFKKEFNFELKFQLSDIIQDMLN